MPLTYATAAVTLLLGSSLLTINMSTAIDGYAEYTDKDSKLSSTRGPIFPSEESSEIELENWTRAWENAS